MDIRRLLTLRYQEDPEMPRIVLDIRRLQTLRYQENPEMARFRED